MYAVRKILFLICFMLIFSVAQSQIGLNRSYRTHCDKEEQCDTINIDGCYITLGDKKIKTDTNVRYKIDGMFNVIRVVKLNTAYSILSLENIDTLCFMYDSVISQDTLVCSIDSFLTSRIFMVMVKNEQDHINPQSVKAGDTIRLRIKRFYNEVDLFESQNKVCQNDNTATIWPCDQCYVVIISGIVNRLYDICIYNRLFRLN